ncbi:hypothetical protein HDE_05355 [Halotydeus destructor]|nr:hypothetical protein HDE_05355 [Halotydeus destructor]
MNLLVRSLNSNSSAVASNLSPPLSRNSNYHPTNNASTSKAKSPYGQLFHNRDSDHEAGSVFPLTSGRFAKKAFGRENSYATASTEFADPFQTSPTSGNSFDYFEYFSNYGRLLSTPPSSPEQLYAPRLEDLSPEQRGPRLGGARFGMEDTTGVKKFWRRSGPPKYELAPDSPDKYRDHMLPPGRHPLPPEAPPRRKSQQLAFQLDPRKQAPLGPPSPALGPKSGHAVKLKRFASSPTSPTTPPVQSFPFAPAPMLSSPGDPLTLRGMARASGVRDASSSPSTELFRISFIETNVYIPRDIPSSPEHFAHQRFHKHLHGEWVFETVEQLREHFKPPDVQILVNVERRAKYPFIIFGSLGHSFDTRSIMPSANTNALSPQLRISDGVYDICGSLTRPGSGFSDDDPALPLGYIISAFQTFPGEDCEKLENNWISWTGARLLYKYLANNVGLRRLLFYKRRDLHLLKRHHNTEQDNEEVPLITYVLVCECFTLRESQLTAACTVMDQLRARCCGYSGLYINQL